MSRQVRDRDEFERGSKWFSDLHRSWDDDMTMIDLDGVGYCRTCLSVLYLVEATRSNTRKTAYVAERLAKTLEVPILVIYKDSTRPDEVLIDDRGSGQKPVWLSEDDARLFFRRIRDRHTH